ncbi:MAG: urease accessory protein UreE [Cellvibrionaceae bacterium]
MIECFEFIKGGNNKATHSLSLTFEQRQKSRGQAEAKTGEKVGWFVERGHVLADGDVLVAKTGEHIQIIAAEETLSEVHSHDVLALTKAAYHLGNRHVPLQIIDCYLHFQHDHVLDDMIRGLGLSVSCVEKSFHPESGAYHSHGGSGESPDEHEHGHHQHEHSHSHA